MNTCKYHNVGTTSVSPLLAQLSLARSLSGLHTLLTDHLSLEERGLHCFLGHSVDEVWLSAGGPVFFQPWLLSLCLLLKKKVFKWSIKCTESRKTYQTPGIWNNKCKNFHTFDLGALFYIQSSSTSIYLYENGTNCYFDTAFTVCIPSLPLYVSQTTKMCLNTL